MLHFREGVIIFFLPGLIARNEKESVKEGRESERERVRKRKREEK